MARRQTLRRAWWQIHKWTGLSLMILLIPLGLSGVVLAWDDAIDQALNPQRYAVHGTATQPPSVYAAAARRALHPDEHIATIRYPDGAGPVVVLASRVATAGARHGPPLRISLWLDPVDAHPLDLTRGDSGFVRIAHNFHGSLFVPGVGRAVVGLLGVAMFLMAAGGVWLWWPTVGQVSAGLRWRRGDRKLDTNLHHRVGFWIALPLAFQAFTGVWIAWPQMIAAVGLAAPPRGGMADRMRAVPLAHTALTPDQALAAAEAVVPGAPASVAWPAGKDGPWRISISAATGPSDVPVDDATGAATVAPPRGGLALAVRHLHDGSTLGTGWRVVMVAWGVAPTLLGITGLLMWWRGRRWRSASARHTAR